MECPSCKTSIGAADLCERCGADLSLFKRVLNSSKHSPRTIPVSTDEGNTSVASSNQPSSSDPGRPRAYRAVARVSRRSIKEEVTQGRKRYRSPRTPPARDEGSQGGIPLQRQPYLPPHPPSGPGASPSHDRLSEIDTLFTQLYESVAKSDCAPKDEIKLTDIIVRERSEQLDLLFHLLDESLSPTGKERGLSEVTTMPSEGRSLISPAPRNPLVHPQQSAEVFDQGLKGEAKPIKSGPTTTPPPILQTLRAHAPSASRLICTLAILTDLIISETLVATVLNLSGIALPLHRPQLATIADDVSSLTLLLALLLPGFCAYRAILLLTTGTTVGYAVYGITPVSLDGRAPSRFQLVVRALVSPVVGLLTAPLALFQRSGIRNIHLIGTRLITTTQEIVSAENMTRRRTRR